MIDEEWEQLPPLDPLLDAMLDEAGIDGHYRALELLETQMIGVIDGFTTGTDRPVAGHGGNEIVDVAPDATDAMYGLADILRPRPRPLPKAKD